jgi:hypothetical protein
MPILEDSQIALHAKDEIFLSWKALEDADDFGIEALERRLGRVIYKTFGQVLTVSQQNELDPMVIEYLSKLLVLDLIRPARDYWSKQATSLTAGPEQSKTYAERAKDIQEMRAELLAEVATMLIELTPLLPHRPRRSKEHPLVGQAGDNVEHLTPDPYDLPALYGPPEDQIATNQ